MGTLTEPPGPMEPLPAAAAFDDPGWLWQLKYDGVRLLAVVAPDGVRLYGRRGQLRTTRYPELAAALPEALGGRAAWLDGEAVALGPDGRPSFPLVLRRALRERPGPAQLAATPVVYAVFDLLATDGRDLRQAPLEERLAALTARVGPGPHIHLVSAAWGNGRAQVAAAAARGLEGMVAKRGGSVYRPGPSADWRKIKPRRTLEAAVVGHRSTGGGRLRSLALAAAVGGQLTYIGDVGSGLTEAVGTRLAALLAGLEPWRPPFAVPVDVERHWVQPVLAARVSYQEWSPHGLLRAPVLMGFLPGPARPLTGLGSPGPD